MQSEEEEEEEEISALQREVLDEEQLVEEEQVAMEEVEEEGVEEESILVQDKWLLFQLQTMMPCLKLETIENVRFEGERERQRR